MALVVVLLCVLLCLIFSRSIVFHLRSAFCNHKWIREERRFVDLDEGSGIPYKTMVSATCSNCGWHRRYKKF